MTNNVIDNKNDCASGQNNAGPERIATQMFRISQSVTYDTTVVMVHFSTVFKK